MKVTVNGRFLGARQTGVQRVAANLALALDRRLAGRTPAAGDWELRAPKGVTPPALAALAFRSGGRLTGNAWEQLELPLAVRGRHLVNLCNMGPLAVPSAVTMIHDAQVYLTPGSYSRAFAAWYRFALPRLAAKARYVATVSDYSARMLARHGLAAEDRIIVIPNGADHMLSVVPDPGAAARLGLTPHGYVFAFGNLQPHKNLHLLLQAFAHPRLKDLKLVVCGDLDWDRIGQAFGAAPAPNVVLAGRLADGAVRTLIEQAACLALPSSTEGFGLPALEAMVLGCPVLAAPAGALPEVCGDAALYAPLDDLEAWVAGLAALAGDADGRAERRRRSIAHAGAYTWDRSAALLSAAIDKAIG